MPQEKILMLDYKLSDISMQFNELTGIKCSKYVGCGCFNTGHIVGFNS
jgi:hypothetical protein